VSAGDTFQRRFVHQVPSEGEKEISRHISEGEMPQIDETSGSNDVTDKRSEQNETHLRLVGETYVHGIMHGEALSEDNEAVETIHVI